MSFDLQFLTRGPGETMRSAMDRRVEAAEAQATLDEADLARRDSIAAELAVLLPDGEIFADDAHRELSDDATGIQVSLFHDELGLAVPYWHSGSAAQQLVELLRQVVLAIEEVTGLTAYDPQADAPFIGNGDALAARIFDHAHDMLLPCAFHRGGYSPTL